MKKRIDKKTIKETKVNRSKTLVDKQKTRVLKSFRLLNMDKKRLKRIASLKRATETRVITELIRLAYAGLFMPQMKEMNEFYNKILNEKQEDISKEVKEKRKRKVLK